MRRTVDDRERWLEENWTVKDGSPWSLRGREWVRENMLRPLYGWRIYSRAAEGESLCARCRKSAGKIKEWSPELEDIIERDHGPWHIDGCAGLGLAKIQVIVVCVNRRGGKTTNVLAFAAERIAHEPFQEIMMFAAAGAQTEKLFTDNLKDPLLRIENEGGDIDEFEVTATSVRFTENASAIHIVDSSRRSVTGRGENMLIVEEARDVDGALFVKALPSILDRNYLLCPNGHRHPFTPEDADRPRRRCPECTDRLEPHYATVFIISSAGVLDDSPELAWFSELVTMLERDRPPSFHLFRDDSVANPAITKESRGVLEVFERVPAIGEMVRAERTNEFRKKGESYVSDADVRRCIDPALRAEDGTRSTALAFLDTSLKKDLISLVVMVPDEGGDAWWARGANPPPPAPWALVTVPCLWMWEPRKLPGGVADEHVMWKELEPILPQLPSLLEVWVDVRVQPWAHRLVELAHRSKTSYGRLFRRYQHGHKEEEVKRAGFKILANRIEGRTLRLFGPQTDPRIKRIIDEFNGLKKKVGPDGDWSVVDRNRKIMHADLVSGLASLCERVWELQVKRAAGFKKIASRTSPELERIFKRDPRLGKFSTSNAL